MAKIWADYENPPNNRLKSHSAVHCFNHAKQVADGWISGWGKGITWDKIKLSGGL